MTTAMNEAEKLADKWEGSEEWMPLAWELCANECGEDACTELVWEGGPIPEPWGDRWLKYEDQAKEMIAMVRKYAPQDAALLRRQAEQIKALREALKLRASVDASYARLAMMELSSDKHEHLLQAIEEAEDAAKEASADALAATKEET